MNVKKLAPWNWLKKEQESGHMPAVRNAQSAGYPAPLFQLHQDLDNMMSAFFRDFGSPRMFELAQMPANRMNGNWIRPTLDIGGDDKEYRIDVELPGVDREDVEVLVFGDTLTIRGEKREEKEDKDKHHYCVERSYGAFQRQLTLPDDADADHVDVTFKKGVLHVRIPRHATQESSARRIEVKS